MNRVIGRLLRRPGQLQANGNGLRPAGQNGSRPYARRAQYVVTSAEAATCTCPDFCERDHEND